MNITEYKEMLSRHDWFYYFSDDHRVWLAGEKSSKEIISVAQNNGDDFKRAYNDAHKKHFDTESFVTEDRPYTSPFKV